MEKVLLIQKILEVLKLFSK